MTYQAIKEMRLSHGARCTDPPNSEPRIYFDWAMARRMEQDTVEHPSEKFRVETFSPISGAIKSTKKDLPLSNNTRLD